MEKSHKRPSELLLDGRSPHWAFHGHRPTSQLARNVLAHRNVRFVHVDNSRLIARDLSLAVLAVGNDDDLVAG